MTRDQEPRRLKMRGELTESELALRNRFGQSGRRFERDAYKAWRTQVLADEQDDLELRARLLEEEAQALWTEAADRKMDANESLSAADWADCDLVRRQGAEVEPFDDGGAAGLEADAVAMEAEAREIATHLAEQPEAA